MSGQPRDFRLLRLLLTFAVFVLVLVSGLSFFGDVHWTFELLSNFRLILLGLNIALAILTAVFGSRGAAVLAAAMAIFQFSVAWPYLVTPPQAKIGQGQTVRILWGNLHAWNTNLAALEAFVQSEKPDIAVFTELAVSQDPAFDQLKAILPFQSPMPQDGNPRAMILLTMRAPVSLAFDYGPGPKTPLMVARLCPDEGFCLTLLGLHAARPVPFGDTVRDLELDYATRVAHRFIELGDRVVLVGDLNMTPFSPAFSQMLAIGGLVDAATAPSERPHIPEATWGPPQSGPLPGFAIDHALLGPGLDVVELRTGPPIGSYHLPFILDVRMAPKPDR